MTVYFKKTWILIPNILGIVLLLSSTISFAGVDNEDYNSSESWID